MHLVWIPNHYGLPLSEKAGGLTKEAITDGEFTLYHYTLFTRNGIMNFDHVKFQLFSKIISESRIFEKVFNFCEIKAPTSPFNWSHIRQN